MSYKLLAPSFGHFSVNPDRTPLFVYYVCFVVKNSVVSNDLSLATKSTRGHKNEREAGNYISDNKCPSVVKQDRIRFSCHFVFFVGQNGSFRLQLKLPPSTPPAAGGFREQNKSKGTASSCK